MKTKRLHSIVAALSLIGLGISLYQTYHFHELRAGAAGLQSFCSFGSAFDCEAIELSRFAELIWGIPLSALAAAFYATLAVVGLLGRDIQWARETSRAIFLGSVLAVIVSILYFGVMAFAIQRYCLLCLFIDGINVGLFGIGLALRPKTTAGATVDRGQWKTFAKVGVGAFVIVLALSFAMRPKAFDRGEVAGLLNEVIHQAPMEVDVPASAPSKGPEDAPITIVKFADFQCGSCRNASFSFHPVLKKYASKIRYVYRHFPLSPQCNRMAKHNMHTASCEAAYVTHCAQQQGKFWDVYSRIFEDQAMLAPGAAVRWAVEEGVDEAALQRCLASDAPREAISADIEAALLIDVQSTPTYFVNGKRVMGALPTSVWNELIERMLKEKQ